MTPKKKPRKFEEEKQEVIRQVRDQLMEVIHDRNLTLQDIGDMMGGVSRQRVFQILHGTNADHRPSVVGMAGIITSLKMELKLVEKEKEEV